MRPTFEECQKICEQNNLKLTRELWSEGQCYFAYHIRKLKTDSSYLSMVQKGIEERERVVEATRYLGELLKMDLVKACQEYKYDHNDPATMGGPEIVSKLLPFSERASASRLKIEKWAKIDQGFNVLQYDDEHDNKCNTYGWIFHILSREKVPFEQICDAMEKLGERYTHC